MTPPSSSLWRAIRALWHSFDTRRRRESMIVLGLTCVGAIAEFVTVGAIVPFLALVAGSAGRGSRLTELADPILQWIVPGDPLLAAALLFAGVITFASVIRLLLLASNLRLVFALGSDLGTKVYSRIIHQPYAWQVGRNSSEFMAAMNKVIEVTHGIVLPIFQVVGSAILALFLLAALIFVDPTVAISTMVGFGLIYTTVMLVSRRRTRRNSQIVATATSGRMKAIQEGVGGIRDILIDHTQPYYVERFRRVDTQARDAMSALVFLSQSPRFIIEPLGMIMIAALAVFMSYGPGGAVAALPVLGALAIGAQRLVPTLQIIYHSLTSINGTQQSLFDVLEYLQLPALDDNRPQPEPLPFERAITLDKVGFAYQAGNPVLHNVDITIPRGSRVGFIGTTGSGKSTVIDLVMGLLEPTSGQIRIDDMALTHETQRAWQGQIAHVPQAIYLADATLAENIAFGVEPDRIDHNRVRAAAARAQLAAHINALPEGYETRVGERGVRLSGGQRQRIGIARALYKGASVLVLDEATSALDEATEASVVAEIGALSNDITILIIAHRLSTIAYCDKVYRLEAGRIKTEGSFAEVTGIAPVRSVG